MTVHLIARVGLFLVGLCVLAVGLDTIRGDELTDRVNRIEGWILVAFSVALFALAWYGGIGL